MSKNQYKPFIDIAKFFCALLVVMIHCLEIRSNQIATFIVDCFSAQAVPFFFIVSGYFVAKKIDSGMKLRSLFNLCAKNWVLLYLVWTLLWLPYYINLYSTRYDSIIMIIIVIFRRVFLAGQGVYWYLLVLAEATFVIGVLVRYKLYKVLYVICFLGLIMGFIYDANIISFGMGRIHQIFYTIFSWSNNVLMKGIPYVGIGYLFWKKENLIKITAKEATLIYVLPSVGMIIIYLMDIKSLLILYPLQSISLFLITNKTTESNINTFLTERLGDLSAAIYFLHTAFIYGVIDSFLGMGTPIFLKFLISIIMSIALYFIVIKLRIKPLKWLIGSKLPN